MAERNDETGSDQYCCSEVESEKDDKGGEAEFVPPSEGYFDYKTASDVENIVDEHYFKPYNPATKLLDYETLKEMLLNESVPAVLCLASTTGLPDSLKSIAVKAVITSNSIGDEEYSRNRCLAAYDLSILSRHPTADYRWKPSSKHCGVAYFILSYLVRRDALHDQQFKIEHIPDEHAKVFDSSVLNRHFHWVYKDALGNYNSLLADTARRQFYRSGVSLIRVWDADGANKAIHEFLRIVAGHFTRSLRLAFFRLDRDADKFNEPLDASLVQHRPICCEQTRLQHLLSTLYPNTEPDERAKGTTVLFAMTHEASVNKMKLEQAREAIMDAAREQHIDHVIYKDFLHGSVSIDKEALKEQQKILEEAVYYNLKYTVHVPLKWIFLRSALAGEKEPKLFVDIDQLRILSKELDFRDEEFQNFLITFTSFGSILYCPEYPPLKSHILTDIPKFCELLNRLCYPEPEDSSADISRYGIISKEEASRILEGDHFMNVLLSLGMAAEVPKDRLKGCPQSEEGYFLPSARRSVKADTQFLPESVYIVVTSNHNPLDIQATLVRYILKEIKETLFEVSTSFNTSCFSYTDSHTHLTLVFHHNSVEIRLTTAAEIDETSLERLQAELLLSCSHAVDRHSDHNKGLCCYIGLTCTTTTTFHAIEGTEDTFCGECKNKLTPFQQSWIKVTQKHFNQQVSYHSEPQFTEMSRIAEKLSLTSRDDDDKSKELAIRLGLTSEQLEKTAGLTGSDKIMMTLLVWKQTRRRTHPLLHDLIKDLLVSPSI